jgi:8-oxo-dGTP pyrophosphatase MutT (NUDIX family)
MLPTMPDSAPRRFAPRLPGFLTPVVVRAIHAGARWLRPLTIGARAAILDPDGRVFLVKHSYVRGWHLPGGAVEAGETVEAALRREVREEAGFEVLGSPQLHGIFFNRRASRRDHVVVYAVREFRQLDARAGGLEIVAGAFFPLDALPAGTTAPTRARLNELLRGTSPASDW